MKCQVRYNIAHRSPFYDLQPRGKGIYCHFWGNWQEF